MSAGRARRATGTVGSIVAATDSQLYPIMGAAEAVRALFRRKYGIPPKGPGPHADSDYGLPLPPASHPQAVAFARAVLRRASQATKFDPDKVAKQVSRAKSILAKNKAKSAAKESSATPWREIEWVDASRKTRGYVRVAPAVGETYIAFRERCPFAMPKTRAARLTAEDRRDLREGRMPMRFVKALRESAAVAPPKTHEGKRLREDGGELGAINGGVVKDVLIIRAGPGNPTDKRFYTEAAIRQAVAEKIFEGAKAFFDHPSAFEEQTLPERSVRALAGWYSDVYEAPYNDPVLGPTIGAFANLHLAEGNAEVESIVRTCVDYAKKFPNKAFAGLSVNAYGDGDGTTEYDGQPHSNVDRFVACESVDIVTKAGAGGAIIPVRESYRMATATKPTRESKKTDDVGIVIDGAVVALETKKHLREAAKPKIRALLEAAGVKLTDEQDKELDDSLGLKDGGAIDQAVDKATGVEEDDADPMSEGDSDPEPAPGDVSAMSREALEAEVKANRAKLAQMSQASKESAGKVARADRALRESAASNLCVELNIPETFRPRLIDEIVVRGLDGKAMREHAIAFDKAFIRPKLVEGHGAFHPGGGGESRTTAVDPSSFVFGERD